jgi:nitroimidazol reductase NimA-like FMN-containing flavoprotein (pyridoxamine 5'-phosphate oxidase superfamily)
MAIEFRGKMFRSKRQTPDAEARYLLAAQKTLHVGTTGDDGYPYVVPLAFNYEGTDELWFHTGWHQGHFFANLQYNRRICVETATIGALTPVKDGYAWESSLICGSLIAFGTSQVFEEPERMIW